ncbi:unnamed protein product [Phytomonas sp. Hart1]|nr:unnamed protein product [Phytomonas sp. Hart1]|eukprot:CCW69912.1 unnamed protein product [Phytomonas sp. isolate Hart1]
MNECVEYSNFNSDAKESPVFATEDVIRRACKKHNGYSTPDLNEKLYLNHLGLSGLSSAFSLYVNCTALYLNHNALHDLTDLGCLINLKSLYLSFNALDSSSSWPTFAALEHLDVSNNYLKRLDDISHAAPMLRTLLVSYNRIDSLGSALESLTGLTSLDLSHNHLESDPLVLLDALTRLKETLTTCVLSGNGITRDLQNYRKRLIHALPALRFLDVLPVAAEERERAEAFCCGGTAAEQATRAAIQMRERTEKARRDAYFEEVRRAARGASGSTDTSKHITPLAAFLGD